MWHNNNVTLHHVSWSCKHTSTNIFCIYPLYVYYCWYFYANFNEFVVFSWCPEMVCVLSVLWCIVDEVSTSMYSWVTIKVEFIFKPMSRMTFSAATIVCFTNVQRSTVYVWMRHRDLFYPSLFFHRWRSSLKLCPIHSRSIATSPHLRLFIPTSNCFHVASELLWPHPKTPEPNDLPSLPWWSVILMSLVSLGATST